MGKYFIEDVKYGLGKGRMSCGPGTGEVIVSINVKEGDESFWISNVEVNGIPNFYISEKDIFDKLCNGSDEEDFFEYLEKRNIDSFEKISLGEYDEIRKSINQNVGNPAVSLIRYIILLTRCPLKSEEAVVAMAKGKYVDELEIPASDVE